jgi:signal transduction histidine kinase
LQEPTAVSDPVAPGRAQPRHSTLLARAWLAALLLPSLATFVTRQILVLHSIPGALLFASVAITAWLGYALPTVAATLLSLLLFHSLIAQPALSYSPQLAVQDSVFCLVAILLAFLNVRLRRALTELSASEQDRRQNRELLEQQLLRIQAAEADMRVTIDTYADQVKALALAQQAARCAAWILDTNAMQVKWLPGGFPIFGCPFEEFEGRRPPVTLIEEEDQPRVWAALDRTLTTGVPFTPEFRVRWPNGELHWQEARGILDPEAPHLIRGTTFDITERKQAELGLLNVEKLAAVGRLASTIAHEINNPLASVTNLLYLALCDQSLEEPVRGYLETAQQELARLSNVTRLTLSYARPQSMARRLNPNEVVESVLFLFRVRLQNKSIRVEQELQQPLSVFLFADELQRILTNLVANAIDAVPATGGRLRICIQPEHACALLTVEDNGSGIPADRAERIFEPFYTTKREVGTGIGLWVTKELTEKNGGSIKLQREGLAEGLRTRFELRFPLAAEQG